jgi:hypothetical protein
VATFYGTILSQTSRNSASIGSVTAGSVQTITGLSIGANSGDVIGGYSANGQFSEYNGGGYLYVSGNKIGAGTVTYSISLSESLNLQGIGLSTPVCTTDAASSITSSGFTSGVNISDTGGSGSDVTTWGICYSTVNNPPTIADSTVQSTGAQGTGDVPESATSLLANTTYYVRGFATNGYTTAYGSVVTITTKGSKSGLFTFHG